MPAECQQHCVEGLKKAEACVENMLTVGSVAVGRAQGPDADGAV